MMTEEQRTKVAELKAAIAAATREGAPLEVRGEAVALTKQVRGRGIMAREVAEMIGVHATTLSRWKREARARAETAKGATARGRQGSDSFRMVRVTSAARAPATATAPPSTTPSNSARGLRVAHAPSGLVVDGLDVDTLVALLRRMS